VVSYKIKQEKNKLTTNNSHFTWLKKMENDCIVVARALGVWNFRPFSSEPESISNPAGANVIDDDNDSDQRTSLSSVSTGSHSGASVEMSRENSDRNLAIDQVVSITESVPRLNNNFVDVTIQHPLKCWCSFCSPFYQLNACHGIMLWIIAASIAFAGCEILIFCAGFNAPVAASLGIVVALLALLFFFAIHQWCTSRWKRANNIR